MRQAEKEKTLTTEEKFSLVRALALSSNIEIPPDQNPWHYLLQAHVECDSAENRDQYMMIIISMEPLINKILPTTKELTFDGSHFLMRALHKVIFEEKWDYAKYLIKWTEEIIQQSDNMEVAHTFFEKITSGEFTDTNAFYFLICAFKNAATKKSGSGKELYDTFYSIAALIQQIIQTPDTITVTNGHTFPEKILSSHGDFTTLDFLISALTETADQKSWDELLTIATLMQEIIQKSDRAVNRSIFSRKIKSGDISGSTLLFPLTLILNKCISEPKDDCAKAMLTLLQNILKEDDNAILKDVFFEKSTSSRKEYSDLSAFDYLIYSLFIAATKKSWGWVKTITALTLDIIQESTKAVELNDNIFYLMYSLRKSIEKKLPNEAKNILVLTNKMLKKSDSTTWRGVFLNKVSLQRKDNVFHTNAFYWLWRAANKLDPSDLLKKEVIAVVEKIVAISENCLPLLENNDEALLSEITESDRKKFTAYVSSIEQLISAYLINRPLAVLMAYDQNKSDECLFSSFSWMLMLSMNSDRKNFLPSEIVFIIAPFVLTSSQNELLSAAARITEEFNPKNMLDLWTGIFLRELELFSTGINKKTTQAHQAFLIFSAIKLILTEKQDPRKIEKLLDNERKTFQPAQRFFYEKMIIAGLRTFPAAYASIIDQPRNNVLKNS